MAFLGQENDIDPLAAARIGAAAPPPVAVQGAFAGQETDLDPLARARAAAPAERTWGRTIDDLARSVASGATFGMADEFAAKMAEITGIGGQAPAGSSYDELVAAERARDKSIPAGVSLPGEIAGGVATGAALAPVMEPILAARGLANLPGWMKAAGLGGIFGGAYGFGGGEGTPTERLPSAGLGAAVGTGAGAVAYPLVRGAEIGLGKAAGALRERWAPGRAADRKIAEAVARDEMTPARVQQRLSSLGPQATLADAGGENVLGLARGAAGAPGPAKNRAAMVLEGRAEGEGERIGKALRRGLSPQDYYAAEDTFIERLKTRAAPLYEDAYKAFQSIKDDAIDEVLATPAGRGALKKAAEKMQNDMTRAAKPDPEFTAAMNEAVELGKMEAVPGGVASGLKLRTLDYVKRALDDKIGAAQRAGERDDARILTGLKNKLVGAVDAATGGETSIYAKARATYSDDARVVKALEQGREFLTLDREVIGRTLAKMGPDEQEAFRAGAVRALKDVVDKTGDAASAARRIFGNTLSRGKVRELFDDPRAFSDFQRLMTAELRFAKTKAAIGQGSRTAPMTEETKDVQRAAGNIGALLGSAGDMGGHALVRSGLGRRVAESVMGKTNPEYDKALARALFNRNQAMNRGTLDRLAAGPGRVAEQPDAFSRALLLLFGQQGARAANERR